MMYAAASAAVALALCHKGCRAQMIRFGMQTGTSSWMGLMCGVMQTHVGRQMDRPDSTVLFPNLSVDCQGSELGVES